MNLSRAGLPSPSGMKVIPSAMRWLHPSSISPSHPGTSTALTMWGVALGPNFKGNDTIPVAFSDAALLIPLMETAIGSVLGGRPYTFL